MCILSRKRSLTPNCTDYPIVPDPRPSLMFIVSHRNTKKGQAGMKVRVCQGALDKTDTFFFPTSVAQSTGMHHPYYRNRAIYVPVRTGRVLLMHEISQTWWWWNNWPLVIESESLNHSYWLIYINNHIVNCKAHCNRYVSSGTLKYLDLTLLQFSGYLALLFGSLIQYSQPTIAIQSKSKLLHSFDERETPDVISASALAYKLQLTIPKLHFGREISNQQA